MPRKAGSLLHFRTQAICTSRFLGDSQLRVSTTQLSDKVRRLKHKYKLQVNRAKNGWDPDLLMEHDCNVYELCEKVWRLKSLEGGDAETTEEQEINESDEEMENEQEHSEGVSKKPKTSRFENANGNATVTAGNGSGRDDAEKGKQMYPYLWAAIEELAKGHPSGPILRKAFGVLGKSDRGEATEVQNVSSQAAPESDGLDKVVRGDGA
jgi:hypothetical protein